MNDRHASFHFTYDKMNVDTWEQWMMNSYHFAYIKMNVDT